MAAIGVAASTGLEAPSVDSLVDGTALEGLAAGNLFEAAAGVATGAAGVISQIFGAKESAGTGTGAEIVNTVVDSVDGVLDSVIDRAAEGAGRTGIIEAFLAGWAGVASGAASEEGEIEALAGSEAFALALASIRQALIDFIVVISRFLAALL